MARVLVLALLVAAALAAPADARWSATQVLPFGVDPLVTDVQPRVALTAAGDAVVVWSDARQRLYVAESRGGARFGRPRRVGAALSPAAIAARGDGRFGLAFASTSGLTTRVRSPQGRWSRPRVLDPGVSEAVDVRAAWAGETLVVAWTDRDVRNPRIRVATLSDRGAPLLRATVGRGRFWRGGELAADAAGHAALTWIADDPTASTPLPGYAVMVSRRAPGAPFAAAEKIARGSAYGPTVAVAPDGRTAIAWTEARGPESDPTGPIRLALADPGAPFGPAARLDDPDARRPHGYEPIVLPWTAEAPLVTWTQTPQRPLAPGGVLATLEDGSRVTAAALGGRASDLVAAALGDGGALLAWSTATGWRAARHTAGAGLSRVAAPDGRAERFHNFFDVADLAAAGSRAVLAWDDGGRVHVARGAAL